MWRRLGFAMATPEAGVSKVIEVERKFLFQDDITGKLRKLGAEHIQTKTFTDSYYDTRAHALTLADHWLRRRDGVWQLKSPPAKTFDSATTAYVETESEGDIIKVLSHLLVPEEKREEKSVHKALSELVAEFELKVFTQFQTERASYKLGDFTVDLDQADFGYRVGEIERLVSSEEEMSKAHQEIDVLALELGRCISIEELAVGRIWIRSWPEMQQIKRVIKRRLLYQLFWHKSNLFPVFGFLLFLFRSFLMLEKSFMCSCQSLLCPKPKKNGHF